jgi:orotidine-5'-phosphate decarboxylase
MPEIIIAVDGLTYQEAKEKGILKGLANACARKMIWGVKISDMLYSGDVTRIISDLKDEFGFGVMADVKLHDIRTTMENSINRLVHAGADIVTVHCSSNFRPKKADLLRHLAGVTTLTSFTDLEVKWIYDKNAEEIVKAFADIALMNHYESIFCSVKDLTYIQENPLRKICSGIRPHWHSDRNDQVRIASVKEAVRMGADAIVIGRPVIQADNLVEVIEKIYSETA